MRANMDYLIQTAAPNDPIWDEYNKYRGQQDRIDDIIYGKLQELTIDCPEQWIGISK